MPRNVEDQKIVEEIKSADSHLRRMKKDGTAEEFKAAVERYARAEEAAKPLYVAEERAYREAYPYTDGGNLTFDRWIGEVVHGEVGAAWRTREIEYAARMGAFEPFDRDGFNLENESDPRLDNVRSLHKELSMVIKRHFAIGTSSVDIYRAIRETERTAGNMVMKAMGFGSPSGGKFDLLPPHVGEFASGWVPNDLPCVPGTGMTAAELAIERFGPFRIEYREHEGRRERRYVVASQSVFSA